MITFKGERRPTPRITMTAFGKTQTIPFIGSSKQRHEQIYSKLGYDWGADNPSAVELARALLRRTYTAAVHAMLNDVMYRRFAAEVVAKLPREAFTLSDAEIQAWAQEALGEG